MGDSVFPMIALVTAAVACVTDLRARRVPNALTFGVTSLAIGLHALTGGPSAAGWSVVGWLVGLLILLPVFALRGIGGGDVKLLAAFGALIGPRLVVWTGLYGAIAGGVFGLIVVAWTKTTRQTFGNIGHLFAHWRVAGVGPVDGMTLRTSMSARLPYALPLTCGLVVALWLRS